jgi:hypothetical protein
MRELPVDSDRFGGQFLLRLQVPGVTSNATKGLCISTERLLVSRCAAARAAAASVSEAPSPSDSDSALSPPLGRVSREEQDPARGFTKVRVTNISSFDPALCRRGSESRA